MSREIHYCKCGQSIFGDMTDCGDCPESVDSVVVGVDPGTDKSAFAIFDGREVISHGIYENEHFLSHGLWGRRHVFCEMIASYGMAVGASVFETCVWIGRFVQTASVSGGNLTRVFRKDVKLHLCQSPRAKDGNVRQALIDRVGPQGTKKSQGPTYGVKSHEWAAFAVAVYGWDKTFGRTTKQRRPAHLNENQDGPSALTLDPRLKHTQWRRTQRACQKHANRYAPPWSRPRKVLARRSRAARTRTSKVALCRSFGLRGSGSRGAE
jgi:hypothetical protein